MSASSKHKLTLLALCATVLSATSSQANTPAPVAPKGDLSQWEQRLLGRPYIHDPLDKRVQRLELLVFGATQDGSLSERLTQLKSEIASRASVKTSQSNVTQSLNQLEQKILKKTFAAETVDVRLARLETKLFGKSNPSMSAGDRIDRLKKTIGIGEPPPIADNFSGEKYFGGPLGRDFRHFNQDFGGGSIVIPFGGTQSMMPGDLNKQMSQMFRQLNDQLRDMHRMPNTRESRIMPFPGQKLRQLPPAMPLVPNVQPRSSDEELPPYLDPNSI